MIIIIMAGGLGKRMQSTLPKVLHKVHGIPMLVRIINQAKLLLPNKILIVVGKYKPIIEKTLNEYLLPIDFEKIEYIYQSESLGTGHAIQCCKSYIDHYYQTSNNGNQILILSGDTPMITYETMKNLLSFIDENIDKKNNKKCSNKIMTTILENPYANGRIIRDKNSNEFIKIVEEKDCTEEEKKNQEVNCGIYVFDGKLLMENIMKLNNNNAQHEYYLTDIIKILKNNGNQIDIYQLPKDKQYELTNVNTKEQLEKINLL